MAAVSPVLIISPLLIVLMAALTRAERRLVARLREADATSPESALELILKGIPAMRLQRLVDSGAVISLPENRYYLDETAWTQYRQERRRRVGGMVVIIIFAGMVVALLS